MGQQQLLLLVLGIIMVGLAVVVGIQAFGENQKKSNSDSLVDSGIRIVNHAQAWALRHEAMGGPATTGDVGGVTYASIGFTASGSTYASADGDFTITNGSGCFLLMGENTNNANTVYLKVTGTTPGDIETSVNPATALSC